MYLSANCISRSLSEAVMRPTLTESIWRIGKRKLAVFGTLKTSQRNCKCAVFAAISQRPKQPRRQLYRPAKGSAELIAPQLFFARRKNERASNLSSRKNSYSVPLYLFVPDFSARLIAPEPTCLNSAE